MPSLGSFEDVWDRTADNGQRAPLRHHVSKCEDDRDLGSVLDKEPSGPLNC